MRYHADVAGRTFVIEVKASANGGGPRVLVDGEPVPAEVIAVDGPTLSLAVDGQTHVLVVEPSADDRTNVVVRDPFGPLAVGVENDRERAARRLGRKAGGGGANGAKVKSVMPGIVTEVRVAAGDVVEAGQSLLVLEAMKMENEIRAEVAGTVKAVKVAPGQAVRSGEVMIEIA